MVTRKEAIRAWGNNVLVEPDRPVSPTAVSSIAIAGDRSEIWYGTVIHTGGPRRHRRSGVEIPPPVTEGTRIVYTRNGATAIFGKAFDRIESVPDEGILLVVEDGSS